MSGRVRYLLIVATTSIVAAGCADSRKASTTRPLTMRERQEQALRDPYGYNPGEMPSVSGGGTKELDKKGLKRDLDSFWNP